MAEGFTPAVERWSLWLGLLKQAKSRGAIFETTAFGGRGIAEERNEVGGNWFLCRRKVRSFSVLGIKK